jgi:hypothetical protein
LHNEIFLARTRKNVAQNCSVQPVHEDLSNGFDEVEVDGGKKPLGNSLSGGGLTNTLVSEVIFLFTGEKIFG